MFLFASLGRSFWLSAIAAMAAVAVAGTAYTASITVPNTSTASGAQTINGYSVSDVSYTLNGANPANIDAVSFTVLAPPAAPSVAKVKADNSGIWYDCSSIVLNAPNYDVTCDTTVSTQLTVENANNLTMVVSQ